MIPKPQTTKILFDSPSLLSGEEPELKKSDFDFIKKLGDGAFGQVWKVLHIQTRSFYAIKQVSKEKVVKMQAQFRREVFIMYNLSHSHIAKLFNHFEDDSCFYLIMELCEGGNLYHKLHRQKCFMEFEAGKYFLQVLEAVSYLHRHVPAIIHRDIKPENILLTKENEVKLTDFGWSNYYDEGEQPRTTVCGTPEYLPPEMVEQRTHDTSADVWCLGVLLYEMLVGYTPFRSQARQNLLMNISNCRPKFPLSFPQLAKDLISKVLVKNTQERLGIDEILKHPWVLRLIDPGFGVGERIVLPPYVDGKVEIKGYKVIAAVKKIKCLDLPVLTTDQTTLQSTGRSNQKEGSSLSNMSLSESEGSELNKDILQDLCQRESLNVLKEDLEGKKKSIRMSRIGLNEKNAEVRALVGKIKELQGRVAQKTSELSGVNLRVQACRELLRKTELELEQPIVDAEQTLRLIQGLRQKFMNSNRASEILKKKIGNFVKKNSELEKVLRDKENGIEQLRNELETFKTMQKKLEESNKNTLLEISKDVLMNQLNPHTVINKETVEKFHRELSVQFNSLNSSTDENLSEKICDLVEGCKQKVLKLERKIEGFRKKFVNKKNECLTKFREKKETFLEQVENEKVLKIRAAADLIRIEKLRLREELQKEKMNEVKFLVSVQEHSSALEVYLVSPKQELKSIKLKTYSLINKQRSTHFTNKEKRRKAKKTLTKCESELSSLNPSCKFH